MCIPIYIYVCMYVYIVGYVCICILGTFLKKLFVFLTFLMNTYLWFDTGQLDIEYLSKFAVDVHMEHETGLSINHSVCFPVMFCLLLVFQWDIVD
jgi:hypothetical protein